MTTKKPISPIPTENDQTQVLERPDGFYWKDQLTEKEYGPFPTLLEARQDMQGLNESGFEEGESLEEAEAEIGIAEWVDPETGELAEGVSTRFSEE